MPGMYPARCMLHIWSVIKYVTLFMTFRCSTAVSRFVAQNIHVRPSRPYEDQGARFAAVAIALISALNHVANLNYCTLEKIKWTAISLKLDENEERKQKRTKKYWNKERRKKYSWKLFKEKIVENNFGKVRINLCKLALSNFSKFSAHL